MTKMASGTRQPEVGAYLKGVVAKGQGEAGCASLRSLGSKGEGLQLVLCTNDLHVMHPCVPLSAQLRLNANMLLCVAQAHMRHPCMSGAVASLKSIHDCTATCLRGVRDGRREGLQVTCSGARRSLAVISSWASWASWAAVAGAGSGPSSGSSAALSRFRFFRRCTCFFTSFSERVLHRTIINMSRS